MYSCCAAAVYTRDQPYCFGFVPKLDDKSFLTIYIYRIQWLFQTSLAITVTGILNSIWTILKVKFVSFFFRHLFDHIFAKSCVESFVCGVGNWSDRQK